MVKKICIVTGTRAEYGLLRPLIDKVNEDNDLELQLIATGMHLSPEFGMTYTNIIDDGYKINEKIEILLSSDTSVGISKSMGLATISFAEAFERLKPDMIVVLGDRYEIFAVCSAAVTAKIPIAHLHGGETTEGAFDEVFRHCITKMSYLHFTSTEEYRKRVIQLGENPNRVFNVGAIGVENIVSLDLLEKREIEKSIGFTLDKPFGLVTFHPVTLENNTSEYQFRELLKALDEMDGMKFIITKANSDSDGRVINKMIDEYEKDNKDKIIAFTSMGYLRYLSAMKYCNSVIGNSSSGIIEAPSFNKPTINIGDRQKGRMQAESVINCNPSKADIVNAINISLSKEFREKIKNSINPYGDGNTSSKIINIIKQALSQNINLKKKFYDIV
ncbi:UDP-N-acetylglucosamine 2-epimerase [Clostridium gasigenes]|uniref:UDP-N-acetylglucosamine 2-epimerase n=2 Tax=Clostridium gasigenes TaxID=94869 RepID=UPI001C0E3A06|nr:UDP-N-acetylglucosamine 2-epimerase [Clostridium gasigenes]MBU3106228.1 UDP-N-acetylglucosamine 2-epimerase (hydrolyzing) [Clostridium gasigenes]MBU3132158.1 UDP-N-acetylglucosamine 2-epimerase (hydrolyzing) [Clostridium gasigenes]